MFEDSKYPNFDGWEQGSGHTFLDDLPISRSCTQSERAVPAGMMKWTSRLFFNPYSPTTCAQTV